jgi:hypothetical protein
MVRNFTAALVAAVLLAFTGIASVQSFQRYDGVSYPHDTERSAICPARPATTNTA